MAQELSKQVYLSAAELAAGLVTEIEHNDNSVVVEIAAGTRVGAKIKLRVGAELIVVEVCERPWGLDGEARLDLAPRSGNVSADTSFWQRASEELVQSARSKREFAGVVFAERQGKKLILSGLTRKAVGNVGELELDASWGALLWHTRPGLLSATTAFSDADKKTAQRTQRPLITLSHTALSPSAAANLLFPMGMRPLMLAAGIKGVLALDHRRRGTPLLLGKAAVARIVYPNGEVALVDHEGASLPRDLYDRAAFGLDQGLGRAEKRARKLFADFVHIAVTGKPPRS